MNGPNRIDSTPVRMSTNMTIGRQTPKTDFGDRVKAGLDTAGSAVANGAAIAAPFVPGGAIVSAAVSSVSTMANGQSSGASGAVANQYASGLMQVGGGAPLNTTVGAGPAGTTTGGVQGGAASVGGADRTDASLGGARGEIDRAFDNQVKLIGLQVQMQNESQTFSAMSNVLKTRHDTIKNSIQNVR